MPATPTAIIEEEPHAKLVGPSRHLDFIQESDEGDQSVIVDEDIDVGSLKSLQEENEEKQEAV